MYIRKTKKTCVLTIIIGVSYLKYVHISQYLYNKYNVSIYNSNTNVYLQKKELFQSHWVTRLNFNIIENNKLAVVFLFIFKFFIIAGVWLCDIFILHFFFHPTILK